MNTKNFTLPSIGYVRILDQVMTKPRHGIIEVDSTSAETRKTIRVVPGVLRPDPDKVIGCSKLRYHETRAFSKS
jgi:hypothetical protein